MRLVDETGRPPEGEDPGEIQIRGDEPVQRLLARRCRRARRRRAGGRTGDVGFLDATGDLFLVDRLKELVIVSGFNVYPVEVEEVIREVTGRHRGRGDRRRRTPRPARPWWPTCVAPGCRCRRRSRPPSRRTARAGWPGSSSPAGSRSSTELPHRVTGKVQKGRLRGMERRRALGAPRVGDWALDRSRHPLLPAGLPPVRRRPGGGRAGVRRPGGDLRRGRHRRRPRRCCERFAEEVPVTFVDGKQHDFWRVDARQRLRAALAARPGVNPAGSRRRLPRHVARGGRPRDSSVLFSRSQTLRVDRPLAASGQASCGPRSAAGEKSLVSARHDRRERPGHPRGHGRAPAGLPACPDHPGRARAPRPAPARSSPQPPGSTAPSCARTCPTSAATAPAGSATTSTTCATRSPARSA